MSSTHAIDALLSATTRAQSIPGVVAMATSRDHTVYEGAFGLLDVKSHRSMTLASTFCLASMTKLITAIAAMQLVESNQIDLDEPAERFAPALADIRVLDGFDENGQPRTRRPIRPITLRHLLTHTSGFSYRYWNPLMRDYQDAMSVPEIGECQLSSLQIPLVADPGETWEYGISSDWVGRVIEGVTGESLNTRFQKTIFDPLGMTRTAFHLTADITASLSNLHFRTSPTTFDSEPWTEPESREFYDGGGGLFANAPDYLRVIKMMLAGGTLDGERILLPETIEEMSRNQIGRLSAGSLRTADPLRSNDFDLFPGTPKPWGLGTMITPEDRVTGRSRGSLCWAGMFNSYFWIDLQKGVGGVLMTQILPFADQEVLTLMDEFERLVYREFI